MKRLHALFLVIGVVLASYLIYRVGAGRLLSDLAHAGWGFAAVVAVALASIVVMAIGWKLLLDAEGGTAGLWELVGASIVGAAINFLTPGSMGGEPVKATLLKDRASPEALLSTVLLHNILYWFSNLLLIVLGVTLAIFLLDLPTRLTWILVGTTLAVAVPVLIGIWLVHRGLSEKFIRLLARLHIRFKNADDVLAKARKADVLVRQFRTHHPAAFYGAFLWVFFGRSLSIMEVWVILAVMGQWVSPQTAFLIQATSLIVYVLFAFIPSQLGANEGASFLLFPYLGLTATTGLAMEVLRRLRVVALVLLGLGLLALFSLRHEEVVPTT